MLIRLSDSDLKLELPRGDRSYGSASSTAARRSFFQTVTTMI
jgi:hypothetical protein